MHLMLFSYQPLPGSQLVWFDGKALATGTIDLPDNYGDYPVFQRLITLKQLVPITVDEPDQKATVKANKSKVKNNDHINSIT
jgi:hypothetical protein